VDLVTTSSAIQTFEPMASKRTSIILKCFEPSSIMFTSVKAENKTPQQSGTKSLPTAIHSASIHGGHVFYIVFL
jgi:hypothetical protein